MLTTEDVANHWELRPETVRKKINAGQVPARRFNHRDWRLDWPDVWSCERGPLPRDAVHERYQKPLETKKQLAGRYVVGLRTVERWLDRGLTTRNVFGSVRMNPADADEWIRANIGLEPHTGGHE